MLSENGSQPCYEGVVGLIFSGLILIELRCPLTQEFSFLKLKQIRSLHLLSVSWDSMCSKFPSRWADERPAVKPQATGPFVRYVKKTSLCRSKRGMHLLLMHYWQKDDSCKDQRVYQAWKSTESPTVWSSLCLSMQKRKNPQTSWYYIVLKFQQKR